jgi:RNA polymerase sigma-70 factor (ECF subfamily)
MSQTFTVEAGTDEAEVLPDGATLGETAEMAEEAPLIEALRAGDEAAFASLVERYHPSLVRLAMAYVSRRELAEEVAQETWLGLLRSLDRFEMRCSFKTWLFRILVNRAKSRGAAERRLVPFAECAPPERDDEPAVDPGYFSPLDDPDQPGRWISAPRRWHDQPEERLLSSETRAQLQAAIAALPVQQREVITLRDVDGWSAEEVCGLLGLSDVNQRVLLHRARAKVRRALEAYFEPGA